LKDADATTVERAILLERGGLATVIVQARLERAHVLEAAGNNRYYLETAYHAFVARRRRRAVVVVAVILGMLGLMYYGGLFS
jgi:hypothetical protein